jgi:hypothetical protein
MSDQGVLAAKPDTDVASALFVDIHRSGEITLSTNSRRTEGTLRVASARPRHADRLRKTVEVNARHGYKGELLCPGVPEAKTDEQAFGAAVWFQELLQMRMRGENGWPPREVQP